MLQVACIVFSITRSIDPTWRRDLPSLNDRLYLWLPCAISAIAFLFIWPDALKCYALGTNLAVLGNQKLIEEMDAEIEGKENARLEELARYIYSSVLATLPPEENEWPDIEFRRGQALFASLPEKTRLDLKKVYDLFAAGDGDKVFSILNLPPSSFNKYRTGRMSEEAFLSSVMLDAYPTLDAEKARDLVGEDVEDNRLGKIFDCIDTDRNGVISTDEIQAVFEGYGEIHRPDEAELEGFLRRMSRDGGLLVYKEEFQAYMESFVAPDILASEAAGYWS